MGRRMAFHCTALGKPPSLTYADNHKYTAGSGPHASLRASVRLIEKGDGRFAKSHKNRQNPVIGCRGHRVCLWNDPIYDCLVTVGPRL